MSGDNPPPNGIVPSGGSCHIPSNAINAEHEAGRTPHTAQLIYLPSAIEFDHPSVQQILGRGDVLSYQRNVLTPDVVRSMAYWRALGKIVVVDLDDSYDHLPPSNPAHAYWILDKVGLKESTGLNPVEALAEGIRNSDALTSPSKTLLADWSHVAPGAWIPNYPRAMWYAAAKPKPIGEKDIAFGYREVEKDGQKQLEFVGNYRNDSEGLVYLGWGGSISHVDSFVYSGILEALDKIFEKHPNVRFKFCGHEGRLDYILNRWGDKVVRQQGVKPEHWPYVVSTFDIGLAPLDMRPVPKEMGHGHDPNQKLFSYDERRSWLKGVEYLCAGVPWIATRSATYAELSRHGTMVENKSELSQDERADNWYRALDLAITNVEARKRLAAEKKKWALKKWSAEANVQTIVEAYERVGNLKQAKASGSLPNVHWNRRIT